MASLRVSNFRRVYRLSRWLRQRFSPAGQFLLLAMLVSATLGIDTTRNLSYQIFSVLVALVIIAMIAASLGRGRFLCRRLLPKIATVNQPVHYRVSVVNKGESEQTDLILLDRLKDEYPSREELSVESRTDGAHENWFDRLVGYPRWTRLLRRKSGGSIPLRVIEKIPAKQQVDLELTLTPLRRGYIYFSQIAIGRTDPFGIFRKYYRSKQPDKLLVLPKRYHIDHLNLPGRRYYQPGGIALASSVGDTTEFHSLRDYQPGDPMRNIHWRSWARTGTPVVKKNEDEFFVRHALILDTYAHALNPLIFEEAVSVAASIALNVSDQESLLDLVFVDRRTYRVTVGRGVGDILSILEVLACVQAAKHTRFNMLEQSVMQHATQVCSAICVFLQWDQPRQRLVARLNAQGVHVVVLVVSEPNSAVTDLGVLQSEPQRFQQLILGDIETGLKQLTNRLGTTR